MGIELFILVFTLLMSVGSVVMSPLSCLVFVIYIVFFLTQISKQMPERRNDSGQLQSQLDHPYFCYLAWLLG